MGVFLFMGSGEIALANLKIHLVHQSLLGGKGTVLLCTRLCVEVTFLHNELVI